MRKDILFYKFCCESSSSSSLHINHHSRLGMMMNVYRTASRFCFLIIFAAPVFGLSQEAETSPGIRHEILIAGGFTGILDEQGNEVWKTKGGAKDATRFENGHILITYKDEVVEFDRAKKIVWQYKKDSADAELVSAWRLPGGQTLITVLGNQPRLIEVNPDGKVSKTIPVDPEQTDNHHMQTRMARKLPNGNYLAPHLLGFSVKEYTPSGEVIADLKTDTEHFGGPQTKHWPFTAIRLENGNTLVGCTYGNRVVEFDAKGQVVWELENDDVDGIIKDACGIQRLPNGNTVVTSYGQRDKDAVKIFEVTPDKKVVWTYNGHHAHHFQVLTTNGKPIAGPPLK
ncbi:MAG: hypothetical protein P8K79_13120 [Mariniblastus sp.]|nr:hypothetical protein [Mariniblastus sp.]